VRRQSTKLSQDWIEEIFKKFIFENSPWRQEDINVQRVRCSGVQLIPTGKMTYDVKAYSSRERFIGNVTVAVDLYVDGEKVRTLTVAGRVEVYANVYHATRPLKQNEMISVADLEVHKMNITEAADRFATLPDQVENRRVLRNIGVHQPLELKDLDKSLVLKRGDPVKIVYEEPGLSVTATGQANADASVGDTLAVVNVSSKKTVYCKVVDSHTVKAVH
jgi:flagella basal body P-ring formation protein FlgA